MSVDFTIEDNHVYCRSNGLTQKEEIDGEAFEFDPFSINVANGNAKLILNYLGLGFAGEVSRDPFSGSDELFGEAEPDKVLAAIDALPSNDLLAKPEVVDRGRVTFIECGLPAWRLAQYWKALREIAVEAKRRGRKVVWS